MPRCKAQDVQQLCPYLLNTFEHSGATFKTLVSGCKLVILITSDRAESTGRNVTLVTRVTVKDHLMTTLQNALM